MSIPFVLKMVTFIIIDIPHLTQGQGVSKTKALLFMLSYKSVCWSACKDILPFYMTAIVRSNTCLEREE